MPYIKLSTNKTLTLHQELAIKEKLGELISIIPGKSESSLMIHIEDNQVMYFRGKDDPCMMISVRLYHEADYDSKRKFYQEVTQYLESCTDIKVGNQYLTFNEYQHWGLKGDLY